MADIEIVWEGLDTAIARVQEYAEQATSKMSGAMTEVGQAAKATMDEHTPVRTGELKAGNTLTTEEGGFTLSNSVKYAKFVNYGTRKMEAEPFLEPAMETVRQELPTKLKDAMEF